MNIKEPNRIAVEFTKYIRNANKHNIPGYVAKKVSTGISDGSIVFLDDDVLDDLFPITYNGPTRKIYIQVDFFVDRASNYGVKEIDVPLVILSGILSRSVYKYFDIYGLGNIDKFFSEMFDCYFIDMFSDILNRFIDLKYVSSTLSEYVGTEYTNALFPVMDAYFKTGKFNRIAMRSAIHDFINTIKYRMREDLRLEEEILGYVLKRIDRMSSLSLFYSRVVSERYYNYPRAKATFKKCFGINFDYAPTITYSPGMEFKFPIELLARVMEIYTYAELLAKNSQFVRFFTKVL